MTLGRINNVLDMGYQSLPCLTLTLMKKFCDLKIELSKVYNIKRTCDFFSFSLLIFTFASFIEEGYVIQEGNSRRFKKNKIIEIISFVDFLYDILFLQ
jgi:hypothetical protein